jgi:hypothetical protein
MNYAYGACLVAPKQVYETVGLLDERFFLQLEETDLYHRAKRVGIEAYCIPSARILHKESKAFGSRRTPLKTYYSTRNRCLLAEKHHQRIGDLAQAAQQIYWTLSNTASARDGGVCSWPQFLKWFISADSFAEAARAGIADYCCRRFGRTSRAFANGRAHSHVHLTK